MVLSAARPDRGLRDYNPPRVKRRLPGCVFLFMGSLFPTIGFVMAEQQRRAFADAFEVQAQIVAHEIRVHEDSEGRPMFGPVLKLRYLADGMPETGEGLLAMDVWSSQDWAEDQLKPWPVGKTVTAWVDSKNLGKAYVVREASPIPYLIVLFPMIFVALGAMLCLFPGAEGKEYKPGTPWAGRTFLIVWNAVGVAAAVHYFSQPGAVNAGGIAVFGTYLGIGLAPVAVMLQRAMCRP